MKFLAIVLLIIAALNTFGDMADESKRGNDLHEKELKLHEMEMVAQFCESKSGSVDYKKGDLHCDSKKHAQTKKFQPKEMPNDI